MVRRTGKHASLSTVEQCGHRNISAAPPNVHDMSWKLTLLLLRKEKRTQLKLNYFLINAIFFWGGGYSTNQIQITPLWLFVVNTLKCSASLYFCLDIWVSTRHWAIMGVGRGSDAGGLHSHFSHHTTALWYHPWPHSEVRFYLEKVLAHLQSTQSVILECLKTVIPLQSPLFHVPYSHTFQSLEIQYVLMIGRLWGSQSSTYVLQEYIMQFRKMHTNQLLRD